MPSPAAQHESLWSRPSGVREVLRIALPMVASTLSWTLMSFIDSAILYRVSPAAMSAAFSAGITWFAALSLFWGVCSYASTFVSQYYGDGQLEKIGPAVWQGVWLAALFTPVAIGAIPLAPSLFALHGPEIAQLETAFFQVLCWGAPGMLAAQALEAFFSGRGRTWVVMCVDLVAVLLNLVLACVLVLGWGGIESWGMEGAAWSTVIAQWSRALMYAAIMLRPFNRRTYNTLHGAKPDWSLFARLIRFGGPSGVQMMLDVSGFAVFVQLVGKLGDVPMEATSMVFRVSHLAFMPVWGLGMATAVLVGQRLGENRPDLAVRASRTTLSLGLGYMGLISLLFVATPWIFLQGFTAEAAVPGRNDAAIRDLAIHLMRFVSAYNIFDATIIVLASVLRGAGDTRFIMKVSIVSAITIMGATWYAVERAGVGVYGCWTIITVWIWLLAVVYYLRNRQGKWQSMRVIDQTHHAAAHVPTSYPGGELTPAAVVD